MGGEYELTLWLLRCCKLAGSAIPFMQPWKIFYYVMHLVFSCCRIWLLLRCKECLFPIWLTKIVPCDCSFRIQASCLLHLCLLSLSSVIFFHQVRLTYLEFTFWELFFESPIYDVSQSLPWNVFVYFESSSVRFYWFAKRAILNLDCLSITVTLTVWVKAFWSSLFLWVLSL